MTDFEIETAIQTAYQQGWNDSRDSMSSQMRIDEAVEKATIELRKKLAVANRYIDLVSRTDKFSGRDFGNHPWKITRLVDKWIVTVKCRNISQAVNDPLEALAIIDGKDVLKEGE